MSIHLLMFSPMASGLFHRAILQSGSALSPLALHKHHKEYTIQLSRLWNCSAEDSTQLYQCLNNASDIDIILAPHRMAMWHSFPNIIAPRVDGTFLPVHPAIQLKDGTLPQVEIMTGLNSHEGAPASLGLVSHRKTDYTQSSNSTSATWPLSHCYEETIEDDPMFLTHRAYLHYLSLIDMMGGDGEDILDQLTQVRPCLAQEQGRGSCVEVAPASSQVILGYDHFCDFDAVFGPGVSQKEVYQACVADLVANFFQGYNVTVVGYGQRGSGKTFTITGPDFLWAMNEEEFGLLPQAVRHVFNLMRECNGREYRIHVSYLVVQREAVFDLLSSSNSYIQLNVLEDNMGNVVIPGLNLVDCSNITEVFNCLEAGLVHRHTASLHSHDPTSHHAIFSLTLEHQWTDQDGKLRYLYSRMNFVDLGGSEGLMQGDLCLPGQDTFFLNSDLKTLSNVIHCLADQSFTAPIPYQESRLTHILKDAFGGNSLSLIVCCLSPSPEDFDATFNTLKYGGLARYILNCPAVNLVIQDSARTSVATTNTAATPCSTNSALRLQASTIRQSHSSVQQSSVALQQSIATNETSGMISEINGSLENEDVFKFQFAASQLHLLVSSAEDLLSEILHSPSGHRPDLTKIEAWLCMKQEAEDCIGVDSGTLRFNNNRVLDVIEELSEPEVNGRSSLSAATQADSDTSSVLSFGEEFYEQLTVLAGNFRTLTNQQVEDVQDSYDTYSRIQEDVLGRGVKETDRESMSSQPKNETTKFPGSPNKYGDATKQYRGLQVAPWITKDSVNVSRKTSSLLCTSSPQPTTVEPYQQSLISEDDDDDFPSHSSDTGEDSDSRLSQRSSVSAKGESQLPSQSKKLSYSGSSILSRAHSSSKTKLKTKENEKKSVSLVEEMKRLSASQESRRGQVRRVSLELRAAQQRLKQLGATIRLKEAFIRELVRGGGEAEVTRRKCEAKIERVERQVERARTQLHWHKEALEEGEAGEQRKLPGSADSLKRQISHYQKKLTTLEKVAHISQQADSKVSELEGSVRSLRRQQEALQARLKEEAQKKEELEQRIAIDQKRIRELEIRLKQEEEQSEGERGWLAEEEERIIRLREATQQLQTEVERREEAVKQRERMHKEKIRLQSFRRSSKGKSVEGEETDSEDIAQQRESHLREEISHLRDARDSLMVRRQKLDRRIHRSGGRHTNSGEERRLLELDEAIEAVDAAIEYKNEVICGRAKELKSHALLLNQDNLMERLMNLCPEETRSLLIKYFNKVIDLRIEFRKQDLAFSELETQYEEQSRYVSDLKAAYQQASLEMERRITSQQRDYQHKIATLLRQFNDDSSGSGPHEFRVQELERQLVHYKKLSRDLKVRLRQCGEDTVPPPRTRDAHPGPPSHLLAALPSTSQSPARPLLPAHPPAPLLPRRTRLQAAEQVAKYPIPQTKVTRERNKIIIQQKSERQGGSKGKSKVEPR